MNAEDALVAIKDVEKTNEREGRRANEEDEKRIIQIARIMMGAKRKTIKLLRQ